MATKNCQLLIINPLSTMMTMTMMTTKEGDIGEEEGDGQRDVLFSSD
jgi:hypothetical protein